MYDSYAMSSEFLQVTFDFFFRHTLITYGNNLKSSFRFRYYAYDTLHKITK